MDEESAHSILADLYDYRRGVGKYDLSQYPEEQHMVIQMQWWVDIEDRMTVYFMRQEGGLH